MKTIRKGWWIGYHFNCKGCGCIFELEESDNNSNDVNFTVKCPTCKKTLAITKPKEPKGKSIFGEIFGNGGIFEEIFGKGIH
jgi:hypothetical protein